MVSTCSLVFAFDEYEKDFIQHVAWNSDYGLKSFNFYATYGANTTIDSQNKWIDFHHVAAFKTEDCIIYPDEVGNGNSYFVKVYEAVDGDEIDWLGPPVFYEADCIWDPDTIVYYNYDSANIMSWLDAGDSVDRWKRVCGTVNKSVL